MPHDKNKIKLEAGDIVRLRFKVASIDSAGESGCNVTLHAIDAPEGEYNPTVVCNSRSVDFEKRVMNGYDRASRIAPQ